MVRVRSGEKHAYGYVLLNYHGWLYVFATTHLIIIRWTREIPDRSRVTAVKRYFLLPLWLSVLCFIYGVFVFVVLYPKIRPPFYNLSTALLKQKEKGNNFPSQEFFVATWLPPLRRRKCYVYTDSIQVVGYHDINSYYLLGLIIWRSSSTTNVTSQQPLWRATPSVDCRKLDNFRCLYFFTRY